MKKTFKVIFIIVAVAGILHLMMRITGCTYLYKGIANTYLKGRLNPAIDEYKIFPNREIRSGKVLPFPTGIDYNRRELSDDFIALLHEYESVAFLVIQNDSLRYEHYWDGFSDSSYSNSFSMAKTVVSILTGIAIRDGLIKNIDAPVGDFLPEFNNGAKKNITIRHLLTMSSGINFDESYVSPFAFPAKAYYGTDLRKLVSEYDADEEPGKTFRYLSGNTQVLAFILAKVVGMPLSEYASQRLWQPLGAEHPAFWSLDHENGDEKAFCCINTNARDFARIGYLYLKKGNWYGNQIVPDDYVAESVRAATLNEPDGTPNSRYGLSWWILNYKNQQLFYAQGVSGQYIIVLPQKNMVAVRLGKKRIVEKINGHHKDFYMYLDKILEAF